MSLYLANQPDPAAVQAQLENEAVHVFLLLEMRFSSGTVCLSNALLPFTDTDPAKGFTWQGFGNLVGVSDLEGGPEDLAPVMQYQLGIPWEILEDDERGVNGMGLIPGLIGDPAEYRNREAILYEQVMSDDVLDAHGRPTPVGIPTALHFGLMDTVSATYTPSAAILSMSVEGPLARKGAPVYGMLTARDQIRRYPGDTGLNYVAEVMSTNPKWTDW
ncbi:hypothetical protein [Chachezhania sediminis]|uniref:hypothetical protein n=1 Tax=Chachezhania sediminis TaxID=2599291 RepID=UPI00131BDA77|nr:hypothetical protein [Chachezhania sediminis]